MDSTCRWICRLPAPGTFRPMALPGRCHATQDSAEMYIHRGSSVPGLHTPRTWYGARQQSLRCSVKQISATAAACAPFNIQSTIVHALQYTVDPSVSHMSQIGLFPGFTARARSEQRTGLKNLSRLPFITERTCLTLLSTSSIASPADFPCDAFLKRPPGSPSSAHPAVLRRHGPPAPQRDRRPKQGVPG